MARNRPRGIGSHRPSVGVNPKGSGRCIFAWGARLIPNPIRKVLSSIQQHQVLALLMGGQACVLYGAAEFSRDADFAILAGPANSARLRRALDDLHAEVIAVPPFEPKYLRKGHAVHFRCRHPEASRMRIDVMTKMRGVESFSKLWNRRTTLSLEGGLACEVISLPDLVKAKKTQRDRDWPMVRRLIEVHYFENRGHATRRQIQFWFLELRTPELLIELAETRDGVPQHLILKRPLLRFAKRGRALELARAMMAEETAVRIADRQYWAPLKAELERLRHAQAHH